MSFETISEDDWSDYEIWTCDKCGFSVVMQGVGGDVCECPNCLRLEIEAEFGHGRSA